LDSGPETLLAGDIAAIPAICSSIRAIQRLMRQDVSPLVRQFYDPGRLLF
jgi:NADPH-dependent ferric siderophore reductase